MNTIDKTFETTPNTPTIEAQLFRVQDKYWKVQESLIKWKPAPVITRAELEDLAINGNVAAYLGDDYQPMNQFKRRLRLPAPPFLFVSRIIHVSTKRRHGSHGSLGFEYDIPANTPFQSNGRVNAFALAEASHTTAFLGYLLLKDTVIRAPSALRAANGSIQIFEDMPTPGETIRGTINIVAILHTSAGKLLRQEYICYHHAKPLFKVETYLAVIDPTRHVEFKLPVPQTKFNKQSPKRFSHVQLNDFYSGHYAACFNNSDLEELTWQVCNPMTQMLHRVPQIEEQGGEFGMGCVTGEFDLTPDHWVFVAHFVNDPVFPASLMSFGSYQLLLFYSLATGFYPPDPRAVPHLCRKIQLKRNLANPLPPQHRTIYFRLDIQDVRFGLEPRILAKATVFSNEIVYSEFDPIGLEYRQLSPAA